MEQIYADDDRVIGTVEYDERDDHWRAQSIHQLRPQVFYDPERARGWVEQLHTEEKAASRSE